MPEQNSLFETVGEFLPGGSAVDKAEDEFSEQSRQSQRADRRERARVTTDFSKWEDNPSKWDYPGVDTPTMDPQVLPKDLKVEDKPRTTDTETPDGRAVMDPIGSQERGLAEFGAEAEARDVSLSPDEAFRGVGALGKAEQGNNPNTPVQDRFARYDATPEEEQEEIDELAAGVQSDMAFMDSEERRSKSRENIDEVFDEMGL